MEADNLFQVCGPATSNNLSNSRVLVRGTTHDSADDERRRLRPIPTVTLWESGRHCLCVCFRVLMAIFQVEATWINIIDYQKLQFKDQNLIDEN